jgi:cyclohexyl-isocyanide hydratase
VVDRNRVTEAGVTSGLDFGLTLVGLLCGEDTAKMAQLFMEYDPQPPFNAGTPEMAGEAAVQSLMQFGKPLFDAFWAQTQATATQLAEISSFRSMEVSIGPPKGFWED